MIELNNEISYDFDKRMFNFLCTSNNNIPQFLLLSDLEKAKILSYKKNEVKKISDNYYKIIMI